jgi:hypothetical protein
VRSATVAAIKNAERQQQMVRRAVTHNAGAVSYADEGNQLCDGALISHEILSEFTREKVLFRPDT